MKLPTLCFLLPLHARSLSLNDTIAAKAAHSVNFATEIEELFTAYQNTYSTASCTRVDTCGASLPGGACDVNFGATEGCACGGRAVDKENAVQFANPADVDATDAMNAACYTQGLEAYAKAQAAADPSLKWQYFGSQEGVLVNYPGFTWGDCAGSTYDPRVRPWFVAGATGPKDLVLVLDTSGSMSNEGRLGNMQAAAAAIVDSLTNFDYVNVVSFSSDAASQNTVLVPSTHAYRNEIVQSQINKLNAGGSTYYVKAINKAFEITAKSDTLAVSSGCARIYVFISDGEPTDSIDEFVASINANKRANDMFFMISLGSGLTSDTLKNAACAVDGVYIHIDDGDTKALTEALGAYYQYLTLDAMINKVQATRWSEPYTSIPDIWGPMVSAATPVYDKRRDPWTMIGVAAVDIPLCELVQAARAEGWTADYLDPTEVQTKEGCDCAASYTWGGKTYSGECTTDDWSTAWCGTGPNCGKDCGGGAVGPHGCWDECDLSGTIESKLADYLRDKSSTCYPATLGAEALETLRGVETCDASVVVTDEWESLLHTAKPAFPAGLAPNAWVAPGGEGQLCDGIYRSDPCPVCNAAMLPACSVDLCTSGLEDFEATTCLGTIDDDGNKRSVMSVGILISIIFGVVIGLVVVFCAAAAECQSRGTKWYDETGGTNSGAVVTGEGAGEPVHAGAVDVEMRSAGGASRLGFFDLASNEWVTDTPAPEAPYAAEPEAAIPSAPEAPYAAEPEAAIPYATVVGVRK